MLPERQGGVDKGFVESAWFTEAGVEARVNRDPHKNDPVGINTDRVICRLVSIQQ
jgi:hypothetical protein